MLEVRLRVSGFFNQKFLVLQVKTIVFDKTGTLTVGKPEVVSDVLFSKFPMEEVCDIATAAEVGLYVSELRKVYVLIIVQFLDRG